MACGDSDRRRCILEKLKCLVENMGDCAGGCPTGCPPGACPPGACPPGACCPPIIEIYDPCPKPAIPLACPAPLAPLDPETPVPHVACPTNPTGGVVIPIVAPQPVPCVPLAAECGSGLEQPCVPCNPPAMMVCYRRNCCKPTRRRFGGMSRGNGGGCGSPSLSSGCGIPIKCCKSRELRSSIMYYGCDCIKRNGLQDSCPRTGCHGACRCLFDPPQCCPGQVALQRIEEYEEALELASRFSGYPNIMRLMVQNGGNGYSGNCNTGNCYSGYGGSGGNGRNGCIKAEYLCYPAYFKMPPCSPNCCTPCNPFGGPTPCQPLSPPSEGPCPSVNECCPMPQCCPPVPTVPLPPCPPVAVPAPPQIITHPIPCPVPTPVFPMCPCPPQYSPC